MAGGPASRISPNGIANFEGRARTQMPDIGQQKNPHLDVARPDCHGAALYTKGRLIHQQLQHGKFYYRSVTARQRKAGLRRSSSVIDISVDTFSIFSGCCSARRKPSPRRAGEGYGSLKLPKILKRFVHHVFAVHVFLSRVTADDVQVGSAKTCDSTIILRDMSMVPLSNSFKFSA